MELVSIGLIVAGIVLLLFGAAISVYAVAFLGVLIGGGVGYVFAPQIIGPIGAEGIVAVGAAIVIGAVLGAVLGYLTLSFATAVPGFVVGAYLGLFVITPLFTDGGLIRFGVAFLGGLTGAILGFAFTKFALVFITAFVGAALSSGAITPTELQLVQEGFTIEPLLFDPLATTPILGIGIPLFGMLFVLGILTQLGLFRFGWVTRLAAVVPGIGRIFRPRDA